jgi:hypothetical protein
MRRNATAIATDWAYRDRTSHLEDPHRGAVERRAPLIVPDQVSSSSEATANGERSHRLVDPVAEHEQTARSGQNGRTGRLLAQIDLTKVLVIGELAAAGTVIAVHLFDRLDGLRGGPRARIQMGPGGWVSMRGGATKIHAHRATASTDLRPAHHRRSARQGTPSRPARGPEHNHRAGDHQPCGHRRGRRPAADRVGGGRRPWWALLLGAKPVETH